MGIDWHGMMDGVGWGHVWDKGGVVDGVGWSDAYFLHGATLHITSKQGAMQSPSCIPIYV